jgi:hypothetical protein
MKGKLIAFASILCIASLMASGANADKPDSPGKQDKPPKTDTELIVFTGDLQGWAHVAGCCPNAGPFPEYTITLPEPLVDDSVPPETVYPAGTYNGELFMNSYGAGQVSEYIVQFHACCVDHVPCIDGNLPVMTFEIIGGTKVGVGKKKDRVLTVTFVDEPYWADWNRGTPAGLVSFEITRAPSHMEDDFPCAELIPSHLCPLP